MIRTGFYGGSFNPIHKGHIALAESFMQDMKLDDVWFVVSSQNPFKQTENDLLADKRRFEMVQLAIADNPRFCATDYEFHLPKPSYTWRTLKSLVLDYPEREFVLLIGADNWVSFPRWDHYKDILRHHAIAVYPRRDYPINAALLPPGVTLLNTPLYDISSTDIRNRIRKGIPVDNVLPARVLPTALKYYQTSK